jgi:hypothetical protein
MIPSQQTRRNSDAQKSREMIAAFLYLFTGMGLTLAVAKIRAFCRDWLGAFRGELAGFTTLGCSPLVRSSPMFR